MTDDLAQVAERVKAAYPTHELRPLPRAVVNSAGIEASDAEFLCVVGVPRIEQLNISFNLADALPSLRQLIDERGFRIKSEFLKMRCLNEKYDNIVGIDMTNGAVFWLDLTGRISESFVNSRVRYLVGFMAECVLHWKRWTQDGIAKEKSYKNAREWMNRIDGRALNEPFWKEVFEEMEQGM